jgi:hypothetical protein
MDPQLAMVLYGHHKNVSASETLRPLLRPEPMLPKFRNSEIMSARIDNQDARWIACNQCASLPR